MSDPVQSNPPCNMEEENNEEQNNQLKVHQNQPAQLSNNPELPLSANIQPEEPKQKLENNLGQPEKNIQVKKQEEDDKLNQDQKNEIQEEDMKQIENKNEQQKVYENSEKKNESNLRLQEQNEDDQQSIKEQNQDEAENDQQGKSMISGRKDSSGSIRQSQIENDTSQLQTGCKKCFNKLCPSKKIHKKIRSRVQAQRYRFLCKPCYENYLNNSFCQFCEQIYSNYENEEEDMNKWVGCDKCERWNHIECEKTFRDKNFEIRKDTIYQCLSCSKKGRFVQQISDNPDLHNKRINNTASQVNKQQRGAQHQSSRNYKPKIQAMKLWINESMIRDDIETLRHLNKRPPTEEDHKKTTKKVKLE